MKRKFPKALRIVLIVACCIFAAVAALYFSLIDVIDKTQETFEKITPVNLSMIDDGVYNGKSGGFICSMDLDVIVKDHRIADIKINHQINGGGRYQASDIYPRIVDEQSAVVDTVSGATLTSKTIMTAVYNALADK